MIPIYKPSGSLGVLSFPLFLLGMVPIAIVAYVYQLAIHWIPLIYVNFLLTIGVGFAVGVVSSFVINRGHVRNVLVGCLMAFVFSCSCLSAKFVFQYYQSISAAKAEIRTLPDTTQQEKDDIAAEFFPHYTFLKHIEIRVQDGWEIGRGGGGAPISGVFVYIIWLIEAVIVIVVSVGVARDAAGAPYSEPVGTWADEEEIVMTLPITDDEMVRQIESAQTVDDLLTIPIPKTDESNRFAVYRVNSVPGQEMEDAYLSVVNIVVSINAKGEQETNETQIVSNAILSKKQRELLVDNASLMQEAFADFRQAMEEEMAEEQVAEELAAEERPNDDPDAEMRS